jgi:hypothetical protein
MEEEEEYMGRYLHGTAGTWTGTFDRHPASGVKHLVWLLTSTPSSIDFLDLPPSLSPLSPLSLGIRLSVCVVGHIAPTLPG